MIESHTINQIKTVTPVFFVIIILFSPSMSIIAEETLSTDKSAQISTEETAEKERLENLKGKEARAALTVLIKREKYPQAYRLASRILESNEGNSTFDMQYGISAIETQHYNEALFAFERLVFSDNSQSRYRLELARTHFFLNNFERSEQEFNRVLKQNPPQAVRDNIQTFLNKISDLKKSEQARYTANAEISSGYDSNINSATDSHSLPASQLVFDVDVPLTDKSRKIGSTYLSAMANVAYLSPISKRTAYDIRLDTNTRINTETDSYNLAGVNAEGGYGFHAYNIKWRAAGRYQFLQLNGESFLSSSMAIVQGYLPLPKAYNLAAGLNFGVIDFKRSSDEKLYQSQLNISLISPAQKYNWVTALLIGSDSADKSKNDHNGKNYYALTAQASSQYDAKRSYYLLSSIQVSENDAMNEVLFSTLRQDTVYTLGAGFKYRINRHLSANNNTSWNYSDSSLEAYSYDRFKTEFSLSFQL